jgi:hypothetical protein
MAAALQELQQALLNDHVALCRLRDNQC